MKEFKSPLKIVGGGEGDRCRYPQRLDMYGCGCQHDCQYCYAKSHLVAECNNLHPQLAHIQMSYTHTPGRAPEGFEKASPPEKRMEAIERLHDRGYDVQLRLSPFIPQFLDLGIVEQTTVDKIVVEFLRINPFIRKAMPYLDVSDWTEAIGGYHHLPLEKKISLIRPLLQSGKRVTVCEDVPSHYEYWREHVNPNREDCCDLERR